MVKGWGRLTWIKNDKIEKFKANIFKVGNRDIHFFSFLNQQRPNPKLIQPVRQAIFKGL